MSDGGKALLDQRGTMVEVDDAFANLLHALPEGLIGRNAFDYTAPADRDHCRAVFEAVLSSHRPASTVKRMIRADGTHVWVASDLIYVADVAGGQGCRVSARLTPGDWVEPNKLLRIAKFIEHGRRMRAMAFGQRLFTDPGWDILLIAYIREAEGNAIDPPALCKEIGLSPSSAIRWLRALAAEQLIKCEEDDEAIATCPFHLTAGAHARIERFLAGLYHTLTPADRMNMPA